MSRQPITALCAVVLAALALSCSQSPKDDPAPPGMTAEPVGQGEQCGGMAGIRCADDLYCDMPQCGAADVPGTCKSKPEACTMEYRPVCACDGKTYGNACSAAMEGVSVSHPGECPPVGESR